MAKSTTSTPDGDAEATTPPKSSKPSKRGDRGRRGGAGRRKPENPKRVRTYPTIRESVELDHDIVKGAFDRHFDGFRSAFFHVTSILGRFGMEDDAHRVHQYIVGLIDEGEAEIKRATSAIAEQIKKNGGEGTIPRTSNNTESRQADIPAFVVRRYKDLFPVADRLIDAIVYAETTGAFSWQRRAEMLRDVPRYLRQPAGRFHSIASKLNARQDRSERNIQAVKDVMRDALDGLLESHQKLQRLDKKRPLAESAAKAG